MTYSIESPVVYVTSSGSDEAHIVHEIHDAVAMIGPSGEYHVTCDDSDPTVRSLAHQLTKSGYVVQENALYRGFDVFWGEEAEGKESVFLEEGSIPWEKISPGTSDEEEKLLRFLTGPGVECNDFTYHVSHYFAALRASSGDDSDAAWYMLRTTAVIVAKARLEAWNKKLRPALTFHPG